MVAERLVVGVVGSAALGTTGWLAQNGSPIPTPDDYGALAGGVAGRAGVRHLVGNIGVNDAGLKLALDFLACSRTPLGHAVRTRRPFTWSPLFCSNTSGR